MQFLGQTLVFLPHRKPGLYISRFYFFFSMNIMIFSAFLITVQSPLRAQQVHKVVSVL